MPMRLVRKTAKAGSQEEAKKKRGDVNIRLLDVLAAQLCCMTRLIDPNDNGGVIQPQQQPPTKRREGPMDRRDLTSPHASNNQQHFLKDTNTKLPASISHLLRQPKSLPNFGFYQISKS
ncbi:hypothetical protein NEUTE1DRAFT_138517 [Neurospora tetrasperma FGSC 2508]|uniref:Uncharacterized protein n=1 Tax=Neurospora tetrasperma (strain FGSC 2508 / ATCC MYA-4615 / P0657) TaxID=510951 RepID=F8MPN8_NEUT8|nr:uncharacterized protein NEUTE1DRAFT_138517 [Neurospora tetrasperma FGSC 2508]EGO56350.1 hypothetical protein NEUTE1DRAFT_138517 [Neurospora tetrasperma FGSC 2508]EGZ70792.1 hypothetical protein NEUTE2DRAFT_130804 [Neurospora tetrasperma FGSC 2509]